MLKTICEEPNQHEWEIYNSNEKSVYLSALPCKAWGSATMVQHPRRGPRRKCSCCVQIQMATWNPMLWYGTQESVLTLFNYDTVCNEFLLYIQHIMCYKTCYRKYNSQIISVPGSTLPLTRKMEILYSNTEISQNLKTDDFQSDMHLKKLFTITRIINTEQLLVSLMGISAIIIPYKQFVSQQCITTVLVFPWVTIYT